MRVVVVVVMVMRVGGEGARGYGGRMVRGCGRKHDLRGDRRHALPACRHGLAMIGRG